MTADQILALLQLVLQLLGVASSNANYQAIIDAIEKFAPEIVNASESVYQAFMNIIADLSGNPNLTAAQVQTMLAAKAVLDARTDADIATTLGAAVPAPTTGS